MAEQIEIPDGMPFLDTSRDEPVLYIYKGGRWLKCTMPTETLVNELWQPVWDALLKGAHKDRQAKKENDDE